MTEIELILGGVLASSVGLLFFLRYLREAKKTKLAAEENDLSISDKPPKTEPNLQIAAENTTPVIEKVEKEIITEVKKEIETKVAASSVKVDRIQQDVEINKHLPQDSMLRRHYLTHVQMMLESIYAPYPTDSVLKRHYQTMIAAKIKDCLNDEHKMATVIFHYDVIRAKLNKKQLKAQTVLKYKPLQNTAAKTENKPIKIPEDSMLRRHYLTQVRAVIKSKYPPCPTDSVLKRHHQTMINVEVEQYLLYSHSN